MDGWEGWRENEWIDIWERIKERKERGKEGAREGERKKSLSTLWSSIWSVLAPSGGRTVALFLLYSASNLPSCVGQAAPYV